MSFRFGSVISGAIQSKLFAKRENKGGARGSSANKRQLRGSFSFMGGMQVKQHMMFLNPDPMCWLYCELSSS